MAQFDYNLNWHHWYERWEAMQNCYIPQRLYRFDLMLHLANLPHDGNVQILDLGCGPGSLAFHALQHYPNARILAVDANSVLLAIGQQAAKKTTGHIQFLETDIRKPDWWTAYKNTFDLVLSATTLHWLSSEHLTQVYQNIYQVLKPCGWFMNSDHIASDNIETQSHYRQMLQKNQQTAFREAGADDWDGFWQGLATELGQLDLQRLCGEAGVWEGNDDGQPRQFHMNTLQQCCFEKIDFYWQDLGEAVIGAQKPLVR